MKMAENVVHGFHDRVLSEKVVPLLQIAYPGALGHKKLPFVNAKFSCEHVQKGCFACAVSSHYAYLVAGIYMEAGFVYDYVCTVNF